EKATVEIELLNADNGANWIINRTILRDNTSFWLLNGEKSTEEHIQRQICKLHIQPGSLCQILQPAQLDTFITMNKYDVLEITQKCVGSDDLYELHKTLKVMREKALKYEEQSKQAQAE
ncbi:unnamed protein product, partial [Didymodactylos carnosus]